VSTLVLLNTIHSRTEIWHGACFPKLNCIKNDIIRGPHGKTRSATENYFYHDDILQYRDTLTIMNIDDDIFGIGMITSLFLCHIGIDIELK
jgi:hypothetical protein